MNQFPADARKQWRKLEERHGDEASDIAPNLSAIGDIRDDISFEIETGPLKGTRGVLLVVARAMSRRCGIEVSTRMAEPCLEEFRAIQKQNIDPSKSAFLKHLFDFGVHQAL